MNNYFRDDGKKKFFLLSFESENYALATDDDRGTLFGTLGSVKFSNRRSFVGEITPARKFSLGPELFNFDQCFLAV